MVSRDSCVEERCNTAKAQSLVAGSPLRMLIRKGQMKHRSIGVANRTDHNGSILLHLVSIRGSCFVYNVLMQGRAKLTWHRCLHSFSLPPPLTDSSSNITNAQYFSCKRTWALLQDICDAYMQAPTHGGRFVSSEGD